MNEARTGAILSICLLACGGIHDDPGGAFSLSVDPARALVRRGDVLELTATLSRDPGFAEPVTVSFPGLPPGVTADAVVVSASDDSATLTVTASADALQGAADLQIRAEAGDIARMASLRLLVAGPPGTLDPSFADAGIFARRVGNTPTSGNGLFIRDDGKILVTGAARSSMPQAVVLRLDPNGTLDDTFGTGGIVSTAVGGDSGGQVITALDGGPVLVGGWGGAGFDLAIFAYTEAGQPRSSFASTGSKIVDIGDGFSWILRLLDDGSGNILAVGTLAGAEALFRVHAARYTRDGDPDTSFGGTIEGASAAAAVLVDGKLVLAGSQSGDVWLARLDTAGRPDPSFRDTGATTIDIAGALGQDRAGGLLALPDGKLVTVGTTTLPEATETFLSLARFGPDGFLDLTFGTDGQLLTDILLTTAAHNAAALDGDGNILVAGFSPAAGTANLAVLRLRPDGTRDSSFGEGGLAVVDIDAPLALSTGSHGLSVDADGRILLVGEVGVDATLSLVVARLWP